MANESIEALNAKIEKLTESLKRAILLVQELKATAASGGNAEFVSGLNAQIEILDKKIARLKTALSGITTKSGAGDVKAANKLATAATSYSTAVDNLLKTQQSGGDAKSIENYKRSVSLFDAQIEKRLRIQEIDAVQPENVATSQLLEKENSLLDKQLEKRLKLDARTAQQQVPQKIPLPRDVVEDKDAQLAEAIRNPRLTPIFEAARGSGFSPEDLKRIKEYEGSGIVRAFFSQSRAGVNVEKSLYMDRFGKVMDDIPRKFQPFGQAVARDFRDLLKWTTAVTLLYVPLQKASEAIQKMIDTESRMAQVSIALNTNVADTNRAFVDLYGVAQQTGESLSGVIDAFQQAYQATGSISNQSERYKTALKLLNDALILSKVSSLNQAEAMDVLSAALLQAGESFDNGQNLLNLWVKVSKVANVDVATLATGVAVLGDSAEAAGLSLQQLNALIATISETSLAGGKEAANIAKALIGNFQSPEATKQLALLGIAVTDVSGKTREFLDVMKEVYSLRQKGLLSDQDFNRLTLALGGGGIRRQKDVSAFIENFGRFQQITLSQQNVGNESVEALAKQLDTVATASERAANAFQKFGQTLGEKGGILDTIKLLLNTTTAVVTVLDKLTNMLGKMAPVLLAIGAGKLIGRGLSNEEVRSGISRVVAPLVGFGRGAVGEERADRIATILTNQKTIAGVAIGYAAISNISQKDYDVAAGNILGGALGYIAGGPYGAIIGSSIGEAFTRTVLDKDAQFVDLFAGVVDKASSKTPIEAQRNLLSEAYSKYGFGNELLGRAMATTAQGISRLLPQAFGGTYASSAAVAADFLRRTSDPLYMELMFSKANYGIGDTTYLSGIQEKIASRQLRDQLEAMKLERVSELRGKLISGEIKPTQYSQTINQLSAYTTIATRYMAAFGEEVRKVGAGFDTDKDIYQAFLDVLSSGNEDVINSINQQVSAIDRLSDVVTNWGDATEREIIEPWSGEKVKASKAEVQEWIKMLKDAASLQTSAAAIEAKLSQRQFPQILREQPLPIDIILDREKRALEEQRKYYREVVGLSDDEVKAYESKIEPFVQKVIDSFGRIQYHVTKGIEQQFYSLAAEQQQKEGILPPGSGVPFTEINAPMAQILALVPKANDLAKKLSAAGYQSDISDVIIASSDKQIQNTKVDMKILQYLLQQILDTEKKQLDGIYNIPEGVTFRVPITAAWYARRPYGGGAQSSIDDALNVLLSKINTQATQATQQQSLPPFGMPHPGLYRLDEKKSATPQYSGALYGMPHPGLYPKAQEETISPLEQRIRNAGDASERFWQNIMNFFSDIFKTTTTPLMGGAGLSPEMNVQPTSSKININLSAATQLIVDGKLLASIIKPYLAQDLSVTMGTTSTISRTFVV